MVKHRIFLVLAAVALLLPLGTKAQSLNDGYIFSTAIDADAWITLGEDATTIIQPNAGDYGKSAVTNIGFAFPFGEESYTQFSVSSDGILRFGPTQVNTSYYTKPMQNDSYVNQNGVFVTAMGFDGFTNANGYAKMELTGDEGSRVLVVELKTSTYSTDTRDGLMLIQYQMYEATGELRLVYGPRTTPYHQKPTQVGLVASSSDLIRIDLATNTADFLTDPTATTDAIGSWPEEYRYYAFTPSSDICLRPIALSIDDITTTEATLGWTARGDESQWAVYLDGEFVSLVSSNSYTFSDLSASSAHVAGVAAICGPGDTSNLATASFRTACGLAALPYSEGFEDYASGSGNRPYCWTPVVAYNSTYPYVNTSYYHTGSKSLYFYYNNLIATPKFNAEANQLHVIFWARTGGYSTQRLEAGIMTDSFDQSTFIPLLVLGQNNNTWTEYEFFTDTVSSVSGNVFVAFRWYDSQGYACYIDDIVVEQSSDCRRPVTATVSQPTYEGATVSWQDNGSGATGYTVRVCTTNNVNASDAVEQTFAASPGVLTGLASNTTYYAWVATNCGSETTAWRAAGSFTTLRDCYPITNLAVGDINQTTAALTWTYQSGMGREATGVGLRIVDQSVTPPDTTYATATGSSHFLTGLESGHTYAITATTECDGDFEAYSSVSLTIETPSCGQIQGTATSSYSPFTTNYRYGYSQTIYPASALQGLSTISGLKFRQSSTPTSVYNRPIKVYIANTTQSTVDSTNYISVDDMTLVYDNNLNLSTIGWKTIGFTEDFAWDGSSNIVVAVLNTAGEYNSFNWGAHTATEGNTAYWYRDGNTPISAASPNSGSVNFSTSTTVPDITFIGECEMPSCLAPVAALGSTDVNSITLEWVAGNNESEWTVEYRPYGDTDWQTAVASTSQTSATVSGLVSSTLYQLRVGSLCSGGTLYSATVQARTNCGSISLPYTETFEGWNTTQFPACWYQVQAYNNYPYIGSSSLHGGSRCMYMYYYGTQTGMFASPEVPADADNIKVTFWTYSSYASPSNGRLKVGVLTNPNDPSSFIECTAVATGVTESSWTEWEFYTDNVTATGNVHIAFQFNLTSSTSYGYVDDITISEAGNCRRPNTPSRNNISYYSATLHWNDVNQGTVTYDIRYSTVNNVEAEGYQTTTSTADSVELTGLHNGTTYYAWVRPQCGSDLDWLPIPSFTTLVSCYPVTGVALDDKTFTTAAISWNYSTSGLSAQGVLLNLFDRTDSTMVVEDVYVAGTNHIFAGLTGGHNYTVYFSTLCDPDTSAATQFAFALDQPNCGEMTGSSSTSYIPFFGNYNYGYSQVIYPASLFASNDTLFGIAYYVNTVPAAYTQRPIDVYLGTPGGRTTLDTNNYVPLADLTQVADSFLIDLSHTGWTTVMFDTPFEIPADSNIVIAVCNRTGDFKDFSWRSVSSSDYESVYWYRDAAYIDPANPNERYNGTLPSRAKSTAKPIIQLFGNCDLDNLCTAPNMVVSGATTTSVSLQWAADNATQFTVEYRATGADEWEVASSSVDTTLYTVTGLNPSTSYQFRVGVQCSSGATLYSDVRQTYTECDAMSVPQTFTFASALSPCWTLTNSNVYAYTSSSALYWTSGTSNIGRAVMPEFDEPVNTLMATIRARYSYSSSSNYNLLVGVGDAQGNNVVWVDTVVLTSSYADYFVYFGDYSGSNNRIVLSKDGYNYIYIESITIDIDNGCHPMSSFSFASSTTNTATFNWSHSSATDFELQYRMSGDDTWQSQPFTGTTGTLTGLNASSTYQARIRAVCTATDSSMWSATVAFSTACGAAAMPWSENFDAMTSFTGSCWLGMTGEVYSDEPTGSFSTSVNYGINSDYGTVNIDGKAMTMNLYSTQRYWALTPEIEVTTNNALFSFDMAFTVWNTYSTPYDDDDRVVIAITTDGGTTFTPLYQIGSQAGDDASLGDFSATYTTVEVPVNGFNGQNVRILIYGGSVTSGGDSRFVVDNLSLTANSNPGLPCDVPVILNTSSTESSVSFSYSGSAASYEVHISQGTWAAPAVGTAETGNSHTFSGLEAETGYVVGVRAVCADGQKSDWATQSVSTQAIPDPGCVVPTELATSGVTNTTVQVGWTENGSATAWQLELNGNGATEVIDVDANPTVLTGLEKATTYSIRVRSMCSATAISGWSSSRTFTTTNVGIDAADGSAVVLYPNPASSVVTLEGLDGEATVTVVDLNGRSCGQWRAAEGSLTLDVSGLASGTYFVRVTGERTTAIRKLIVR